VADASSWTNGTPRFRWNETPQEERNAMSALIEIFIALPLVALLLLVAPGPSMAADAMKPASQSVYTDAGTTIRFADLDLSKPQGVATLYARIRRTAHDICGDADGRYSLKERCIARTIEDAVSRINEPPLTALHTEHLKRALGS
jgi:UrcA family protein